MIALMLEF